MLVLKKQANKIEDYWPKAVNLLNNARFVKEAQ